MKRTNMHSLEPSSARRKIAAAKSNKPFMAALLDRDHRGHKEAVDQWTRLHEAGFPDAGSPAVGGLGGRGTEKRSLVTGGAVDGARGKAEVGNRTRTAGTTRQIKSRLQEDGIFSLEQSSGAESGDRPVINMSADRIRAILDDAPALFEIEENPDADKNYADSYADHDAGAIAVSRHNSTIEREAASQRVDPDLVKAIMYVENAHGQSYSFAEALGVASTILPMNINKNLWSGLGAEPEEFSDPEINIRVGVTLIRRLRDRIDGPTPAAIASIWNFAGHEVVSDFGARVQDVYERKLWLEPLRYDLQGGMSDMEFGTP